MGCWSGINVSVELTNEQKWACVLAEKLMLVEQFHTGEIWKKDRERVARMKQLRFSKSQAYEIHRLARWLSAYRRSPVAAWKKYSAHRDALAKILGCEWQQIQTTPTSVEMVRRGAAVPLDSG